MVRERVERQERFVCLFVLSSTAAEASGYHRRGEGVAAIATALVVASG